MIVMRGSTHTFMFADSSKYIPQMQCGTYMFMCAVTSRTNGLGDCVLEGVCELLGVLLGVIDPLGVFGGV